MKCPVCDVRVRACFAVPVPDSLREHPPRDGEEQDQESQEDRVTPPSPVSD